MIGAPMSASVWWVSASQVSTYRDCARKWAWSRIRKIPGKFSPSAARGTKYHGILDRHFTGKAPIPTDDPLGVVALEALNYLPPASTPGLETEHWFHLDLGDGIGIRGKKDLAHGPPYRPIPKVWDHKSTGNLDYAMGPNELATDTQGIIYGYESLQKYRAETVDLEWLYARVVGRPKIVPVQLRLTRAQIEPPMFGIRDDIVTMRKLEVVKTDPLLLEPTLATCSKYDGCPYREHCTDLTADDHMRELFRTKTGEIEMSVPNLPPLPGMTPPATQATPPPPAGFPGAQGPTSPPPIPTAPETTKASSAPVDKPKKSRRRRTKEQILADKLANRGDTKAVNAPIPPGIKHIMADPDAEAWVMQVLTDPQYAGQYTPETAIEAYCRAAGLEIEPVEESDDDDESENEDPGEASAERIRDMVENDTKSMLAEQAEPVMSPSTYAGQSAQVKRIGMLYVDCRPVDRLIPELRKNLTEGESYPEAFVNSRFVNEHVLIVLAACADHVIVSSR